jgi:hypothetical protein
MIKPALTMALMIPAIVALAYAQSKTVTFQQGLDGYGGCVDKELRNPEKNYGKGPTESSLLINEY